MKRKAFTLIELLVVVSIIAILISILIPALSRAKEVARRAICAAHLKGLGSGIYVYANGNNDQLPIAQYQTGLKPNPRSSSAPGAISLYAYVMLYLKGNLSEDALEQEKPKARVNPNEYNNGKFGYGELFMNDIVVEGKAFYCPSAPKPPDDNQHFAYKYYSNNNTTFPFFDMLSPRPWRTRSSYMYVPQSSLEKKALYNTTDQFYPATAKKISELNSTYLMGCDVLFGLDWLPHKKGKRGSGVNVLFSDGNVSFSNDPDAFDPAIWPLSGGFSETTFRKIIKELE